MRKLKLQVQLSIDGFHSGPNGELDWMNTQWDDKLIAYVRDITEPIDTILLGRKMADGFINFWESVYQDPSHPEYEGGVKFVETPKIVFTKTLTTSPWKNTTLATGDLVEEIKSLKNQDGSDIIVYGGTGFVSNLVKEGLIDEYNLFIIPTAIGKGASIFALLDTNRKLELKRSIGFDCGIVALQYERKEQ